MNILIATHQFTTISGSPVWCYELGRVLTARGHHVTIAGQDIGGVMTQHARDAAINVVSWADRPPTPDILHVTATGPAHWAINRHPDTPAISTIHSTLTYEQPYQHPNIKRYVAVRPQIIQRLLDRDGIPAWKTEVIYNGVDRNRFFPDPAVEKHPKPTILFAGTVDYLRAAAAHHTNTWALSNGYNVLYIGRKMSGQLDDLPSHVRYLEGDRWNIEEELKRCHLTAGILLGRTTIEGWACGLPGFTHEIDDEGTVLDSQVYGPPHPQVMAQFDIEFMATQYERLYANIL